MDGLKETLMNNQVTINVPVVFDLAYTINFNIDKYSKATNFIIDFSNTKYLDNSAISMFKSFLDACGNKTRIVGCNSKIANLFSMLQL